MLSSISLAAFILITAPSEALDRSAIQVPTLQEGLNTHLILGNGDLMAYIEVDEQGDLIIGTSKNDVWDIRLDTSLDEPLLPITEVERIAHSGDDDEASAKALKAMVRKHAADNDSYHRNPYPSPRMTARWRVPLSAANINSTKGVIDLRTATATIHFAEGGGMHCAIHAEQNVLALWPMGNTTIPAPELLPIIEPELIPEAETGESDGTAWLFQKLPDDLDQKGIHFAAAAKAIGGWYALAQATTLEMADPKSAALALVSSLPEDTDTFLDAHHAWWQQFWSRSSVELADPVLEALWHQQVYFIGSTIRENKYSPGLFAPLTNNAPAWHGDYHTNYNIQQTYWPVLPTNHPELMQPYNKLIADYLPRAQWLAQELYGVSGAYYPHVIMFDEPAPGELKAKNQRQYFHVEWAYTLGVTSFTVQNLWWHYQYAPDKAFLKETAYPVISETAEFYANLLEKYKGDDGKSRPPTVSPEHWGWTANLERNRNCTFDTALIADNLIAAANAAEILGVDRQRSARWLKTLELLPDYPTYESREGTIIVDIENAEPTRYNIPIPSTVVFPGEQLTFQSPASQKELFTRTIAQMDSNGNNDMVINSVARARLDMPDAYDYVRREYLARRRDNGTLTLNRQDPPQRFNAYGHYTEMYGAATAVSELLLQSVGDVIRVFPAWPEGKAARFTTLRAKGGFLVSAAWDGEKVTALQIDSTAGGLCTLLPPWKGIQVNGIDCTPDRFGIVRFPTKAGQRYVLSAKDS